MTKSQQRSRKPSALVIVALLATIGAMSFATLRMGGQGVFRITSHSGPMPTVAKSTKATPPVAAAAPAVAAAPVAAAAPPTVAKATEATAPTSGPADIAHPAEAAGAKPSAARPAPADNAPAVDAAAAAQNDPTARTRETAAAAPSPTALPASLPTDDYYAKRAKDLVERDAEAASKAMSLAEAFPDRNVVVCEAGCYGRQRSIVFAASRTPTEPVRTATMQPLSSDAADAPEVTCVAGCYDGARRVAAAPARKSIATLRAEMDAVAAASDAQKLPEHAVESSEGRRWMTTSSPAPGADGAAPRSSPQRRNVTPRPGASPSGDWFRKINAERPRAAP